MVWTQKFCKTLYLCFVLGLIVASEPVVGRTVGIASPVKDSQSHFTGILGRSIAVQMDLTIRGDSVSGSYYYEKVGKLLNLSGSISQDGRITIDEVDENDKKTGTFKGQFARSQEKFEGTWSSTDQKTHFPFRLSKVAEYVSLTKNKEGCWSTESADKQEQGDCSLSFEYPRFLSTSPGLHQINNVIEKRITDEFNEFSRRQSEKEEERNRADVRTDKGTEWYDAYGYTIEYYGPELISLLVTHGWYAGGIHSNIDYKSANFSITGGKAVSLKLADLFLPQATYVDVLSDYCIEDLRKQEAGHVKRDDILRLNEDDLSVLSILPSGIKFSFQPYAVGPYSEGSYFVIVPYQALRKIIQPNGPLRRFLALMPASDLQQRDR